MVEAENAISKAEIAKLVVEPACNDDSYVPADVDHHKPNNLEGTPMSYYGVVLDLIEKWVPERKAELSRAWSDAVYAYIKGSPWAYEVEVLIDDALDAHVRAERWAHMRGDPVPCSDEAMKAMIDRLRALESDANKFWGGLPRIVKPQTTEEVEIQF